MRDDRALGIIGFELHYYRKVLGVATTFSKTIALLELDNLKSKIKKNLNLCAINYIPIPLTIIQCILHLKQVRFLSPA